MTWAGGVCPHARPWAASMFALSAKYSTAKPHHHIYVAAEIREDAATWLGFFTKYPMIPIFRPDHPSSPRRVVIGIGDAAGGRVPGEGFGAFNPATGEFFCHPWPETDAWRVNDDAQWACEADADPADKLSSTAQEIVPLAVALRMWGSRLARGSHLGYTSDNKNLVKLFNQKFWSKRPTINRLIIYVLGICADLGVNLTVDWHDRETASAKLADTLSRNLPAAFQEQAGPSHRGHTGHRTAIPGSILKDVFSCRQP